ncbi:4-oxalocrotonate tautomerase family protein [Pseudonocardia sp. GCM10023141]
MVHLAGRSGRFTIKGGDGHAAHQRQGHRRRVHRRAEGEMVKSLTEAMVAIEGENLRGVTWVVIDEVKSGDWGVGGNQLTTEAVQALAAGAA